MTIPNVAAPLVRALADKGYETLTAVQTAVLAEGVAGRDTLVSAQTGSGKTVAFGLAIAPEILQGQDVLLYADKPVALIIAPTRELALQVARELEWLYAPAQARLATCVGGMDYRTERRALDRGAHIVVGTPGRLRDHIERGSLDLSALRAVVLDEADEMLDLGFAEDLEFILAAAPPDRRTLMFSATVPREIEKLAGEFQKDALRIVAQGEAKQHVDIEYHAYSVTARDREHAIFNVLRFYEARTAIVFCKTRVNVNHLLARMGNRGFQVVALSGELSQQERTHALQALRDGRARVCIATDVAARGIDLPGLELVVHADLPTNPDTLLHRSGRTGRAGKKGVSALIVTPAEFKKAQRILAAAKVVANWGAAPGADEVQAKDDLRILEHPALTAPLGDEAALADSLLDQFGPQALAAAFVRLWREGRSAPEVLSTDTALPSASSAPPHERAEFGPSVWFRLTVGHSGRAEARWLLPKMCEAGGIAKDGIGAIRVRQDETFVQIAEPLAARFGTQIELDTGILMQRLDGEPLFDPPRPDRTPRRAPPDRPRRPALDATGSPSRPKPKYDHRADPAAVKPAYKLKPPRFVEDESHASAPPKAAPKTDRPFQSKPPRREDDRRAEKLGTRPIPHHHDDRPRPERWKNDQTSRPRGSVEARPEGSDDRPFKPRWSADQRAKPRSAGFKSHGGSPDQKGRAAGFKSHSDDGRGEGPKKTYAGKGDEARPFARREGGGKSGGFKSHGGAGKPGGKPRAAKPAADPRDTSKRFVPPKGPKK